jgi:hypothetical protein
MKANAVRFAAGLALVAFAVPFPACGQFFYPPVIIVPPPAQNYATPISRARAAWTAMSDDPTYLAQFEPILEGMRKAGVPEE